ncbi:MAG: dephospho-CoA kinase [Bryobacteraceae bacterium]
MLKVGLTGGLASGKSFVGAALERLGCHLIQADRLGHEIISPGGEAYEQVVAEFGPEILAPEGGVNRRRLAAIVFGDPERLAKLNALVHPAVFRREDEIMDKIRAAEPDAIVVVEAAILIETGSYKRFDKMILVVAAEEQQIQRAMKRDGVSREEALARLKRQMPLSEKRKFADFVIDTSGDKESTLEQTGEVYRSLRSITE